MVLTPSESPSSAIKCERIRWSRDKIWEGISKTKTSHNHTEDARLNAGSHSQQSLGLYVRGDIEEI